LSVEIVCPSTLLFVTSKQPHFIFVVAPASAPNKFTALITKIADKSFFIFVFPYVFTKTLRFYKKHHT